MNFLPLKMKELDSLLLLTILCSAANFHQNSAIIEVENDDVKVPKLSHPIDRYKIIKGFVVPKRVIHSSLFYV